MTTAISPASISSGGPIRRSCRAPVGVGLMLLGIMVAVWWSFFALRDDQSVRVLFSAGTYTHEAPGVEGSRATGTSLKTGRNGFVSVRLSDGSVVKRMPNTHLDIKDARSNSRKGGKES
ncbi:MAG: hypothetical protein ACI9DC_001620 [Gammaproteobacteria bacterium]|jgi:hypothetical protein